MPESRSKANKIIAFLTVVIVLCTTLTIIISTIRASGTDSTLDGLNRNNKTSLCTVRILKQISASGGTTEQERRASYNRIFEASWLKENCGLSEEEARTVSEGK